MHLQLVFQVKVSKDEVVEFEICKQDRSDLAGGGGGGGGGGSSWAFSMGSTLSIIQPLNPKVDITRKKQFFKFCRHKFCICILGTLRVKLKIGLTLKAPIVTAADDIHKYFFIVFQS